MSFFSKLFGKKPIKDSPKVEQAVIVQLDAVSLPQEIYDKYDLSTLEDSLIDALGEIGEYDGNEIGGGHVKIFIYGGMQR